MKTKILAILGLGIVTTANAALQADLIIAVINNEFSEIYKWWAPIPHFIALICNIAMWIHMFRKPKRRYWV